MNTSKIQVLLADGRKLFREALSLLLERHPQIQVTGEAENARDVPRLVRALPIDIVLLIVVSPANLDANLVRAILRARPGVRLMVLAATPAMELVQSLLDAGASACLTRECAGAELLEAIQRVAAGGIYLSPALVQKVVQQYVCPSAPATRALAPRERQILRHIAGGETTKEIAAVLGVSPKTVETHRRRIMEKLNRHSVAELTKYAVLEGLTSLEPSS